MALSSKIGSSTYDRLRASALGNSTYTPTRKTSAQSQGRSTATPTVVNNRIGLTDLDGGTGNTPYRGPAKTARQFATSAQSGNTGGPTGASPSSMAALQNASIAAAAQAAQIPQTGSGFGYNDAPQGGFTNNGDSWTGFSQRYAPAYADILLSNPTQIFYDTASAMGLQQPGGEMGAVQALAPYAELMPLLYAMQNSGRGNAGSREAQVNFVNDFAQNMLTPGGQDISLQGMMSAIYGNPDMQELYNTGNPAQNVNELNNLISGTAALSFNPVLRNMVQARNDRLAYEYLSQYTQGQNPGGYADYVRSRGGAGSFYG